MPANWLKLLAFAFGAAVAALTGTIFASLNVGVFPETFQFPLLITVYAMVILGGVGSQTGAVLGAIVVYVLLEALREPGDARWVFYVARARGLVRVLRLSVGSRSCSAARSCFGFVVHAIAGAIADERSRGRARAAAGSPARSRAGSCSREPRDRGRRSRTSASSRSCSSDDAQGLARSRLLVPTLYLAAFVWENVMLAKPEPTRYILLGAILVALMVVAAVRAAGREARGDRLVARSCSS